MGTKEEQLKKYKNLWIEFEAVLQTQDLNLSSFSKKWEKYHSEENSDYKAFYNRIKKQKHQLKALKSAPQENTILQLQEYIKFLNNGLVSFEALDDEKFGSLF